MLRQKNRKAQGITAAISYLGSVIIVIVFMILLNLSSCESKPQQKISSENLADLKLQYDITSFAASQANYNGNELTAGDLILLALYNENERESLVNEEPFPTRASTISNAAEYILALEKYRERDKSKLLTSHAITMMKSYADYVPSSVATSYYCSLSLVAEEYSKNRQKTGELRIFDMEYQGILGGWSCHAECVIAETTIPTPEGYASIQLRSKLNSGLLAITFALAPGIFLTDYICPMQYFEWL